VIPIGSIGVESFADKAQIMLVDYIRATYCDQPTDWAGSAGWVPLQVADIKSVLMPRQAFLRKLDPTGKLPIAKLQAMMATHAAAFRRLVADNIDNGEDIKLALKIYSNFHLIQYKPEWVDYPA
jgi:hypothetical protein